MNKFEKTLLTFLFVEIFIGGGGRLIDFGFLSIRQVLFLLLILTFIFRIIRDKAILNRNINTFIQFNPVTIGVYTLMFWFFISSIIGLVNDQSLSAIVTDFFRVSFLAAYFPLAYYISEERFTKKRFINLLKISALIVAIFTIVVSLLGKTVFSGNFTPFYNFMNMIMNDDLFFRPSNSVFYKSHFYVLIGLILSINAVLTKQYSKIDVANIIFCTVSVLWSETRGFLLAFIISILMILLLDIKLIIDPIKGVGKKLKKLINSKQFIKKSIILMLIVVSVPFLYKYMTLQRFEQTAQSQPEDYLERSNIEDLEDVNPKIHDESVNVRLEIIMDSKDILLSNAGNFLFGSGYGKEIAGRLGIEISFLEILVKQGLIGLLLWLYLILLVFYNYYYAYKRGKELTKNEISLLAAFVGVLLLTNINPFINNPIGMCFFLVILILSKNKKQFVKIK